MQIRANVINSSSKALKTHANPRKHHQQLLKSIKNSCKITADLTDLSISGDSCAVFNEHAKTPGKSIKNIKKYKQSINKV